MKIGIVSRGISFVRDLFKKPEKKRNTPPQIAAENPKYERYDQSKRSDDAYSRIKSKVTEFTKDPGEISKLWVDEWIEHPGLEIIHPVKKPFNHTLQHSKKKSQSSNWQHWKGRK